MPDCCTASRYLIGGATAIASLAFSLWRKEGAPLELKVIAVAVEGGCQQLLNVGLH